jgi:putative peptide zinc metalloprotease protein
MLVGAAGILVEAFLGSLALFVWLSVEPGNISAIAYSIMLIGGVSTVLFNGNPLLRFDGYHILGDALEIPNLGNRSNAYLMYLMQRYVLRARNATSPVTAPGERFWLPAYGLAAFAYRMFIMIAIVVFVASKFFFVGVLIAMWSLFALIVMPFWKAGKFLVSSPVLARRRGRAVLFSALALPEQSMVRAGTDGTMVKLLAEPNSIVRAGDPLLELEDSFLPVRVRLLESRLEELEMTQALQRENDLVMAQNTREQIFEVQENLDRAIERLGKLTIRAPADGVFVVPADSDLPDQFLRQGQLVGYILNPEEFLVRIVVPQDHIALVRENTRGVRLRLAGDVSKVYDSAIARQVPGATDRLPNAALGTSGGGDVIVDPRDNEGLTTLQKVFQFDVSLPGDQVIEQVGGRVYVRFDHGTAPLGTQIYNAIRRLLLRQFNV